MNKKTLAFEIGTEELPAFDLHAATKQMAGMVESMFGSLVSYDDAKVYSTPRRIIVIVSGVPESTEAYTEEFRGPEARIAFDSDGNPTKAATGFARGKGVDVASLELREENGKQYVYAVRSVEARKIADMLPDVLMNLITGITWPKTQRWGDHDELFSRRVLRSIKMIEQVFRVFPDGIGVGLAGFVAVNKLRADLGVHVLSRYTALEHVVIAVFLLRAHHDLLRLIFGAGVGYGELHVRSFAFGYGVVKQHVEVDRDVAVEAEGVTRERHAHAVVGA